MQQQEPQEPQPGGAVREMFNPLIDLRVAGGHELFHEKLTNPLLDIGEGPNGAENRNDNCHQRHDGQQAGVGQAGGPNCHLVMIHVFEDGEDESENFPGCSSPSDTSHRQVTIDQRVNRHGGIVSHWSRTGGGG